MIDLLPCPFCGGEAEIKYWSGGWPDSCYRAGCKDWKCPGKTSAGDKALVVAAWNTRTPPPGYALVKLEGAEERVARALYAEYYIYNRQEPPEIFEVWKIMVPKAQAAIRALTEES